MSQINYKTQRCFCFTKTNFCIKCSVNAQALDCLSFRGLDEYRRRWQSLCSTSSWTLEHPAWGDQGWKLIKSLLKNPLFITSTKEVMFSPVCVGRLVCLSAGLHKNYRTDFHETWMGMGLSPEQTLSTVEDKTDSSRDFYSLSLTLWDKVSFFDILLNFSGSKASIFMKEFWRIWVAGICEHSFMWIQIQIWIWQKQCWIYSS